MNKPFLSVVSEYIPQKTTSDNTKALIHIMVIFFSCALMCHTLKFKSEILTETHQTKRKEKKHSNTLNC